MAYSNTTKGIRIPLATDQYNFTDIDAYNWQKINDLFAAIDTLVGDKATFDSTTMTAEQKTSFATAIVAAFTRSATDTVIGNRAVDQSAALPAAHNTAGTLTSVISWFGRRFKDILGTTNWIDGIPTIGGVAATLAKIASMLDQDVKTGSAVTFASVTATDIYGANYNDIAEWYNRIDGDKNILEPGDVIVYCPHFGGYTRSMEYNSDLVVGIYSGHPGFTLGGEQMDDMRDNIDKYIPVALSGRVPVKVSGVCGPGSLLISAPFGYACTTRDPKPGHIVGKALHPINTRLWMAQVMLG